MKLNANNISCAVCLEAIENLHYCFDHRIEKLTVSTYEGKQVTSINIEGRESLFMYCSRQCWKAHEPVIKKAFGFKQTFPVFSFVSSCSKCSKLVNRTSPYVCYSISKMEFDGLDKDVTDSHCLDDDDYAVLCRDCEDLDHEPEAEVALERIRERESIE